MIFSCEQLAGFAEIEFYLLTEVVNFPFVVTDENSNQIVIQPEINDVEATIELDSINVDVLPKKGNDGTVHEISIAYKIITRSDAIEQLLDQYQNKPGIAVARMNNEFKKIYGTPEEPLYLNFKVDEGQKIDDAAGILINIKGETRDRPVYYAAL